MSCYRRCSSLLNTNNSTAQYSRKAPSNGVLCHHPTQRYASTESAKMEATFVYATGVLVLAPTKRIVRRAYTHRVGIDTNN